MTDTASAIRSGLFTTGEVPVPLAGVSIDAVVSNLCARVTVSQRYVNRESTPIEAVYVFPLDEGAAVCGFEAIVDGTLVVGEVKEREEAFKIYDDAMEQGHGGFLLDEERPDVFQASVGNLLPGKEALLKISYVTELTVEGREIRFAIPTTVSPRYAPAADRVGVGRPDSETLNPPVAWSVPYGLSLTVQLEMTNPIASAESPSHPIGVTLNGDRATVTLSQRDAALDRDFVLNVTVPGIDVPQAWLERDDEGTEAIAVAFAPKSTEAVAPAEIIFLVDRSGSMNGNSIEEVRNALQLSLRSMIAGCRFNIIGFGSNFECLFPETRVYDEASLTEASAHVAAMEANLGGTEILPALKAALEKPRGGSLARQIVVLTDGQVTNTDAVLALAKQHAATARIFTFGIGAGASHHLVKGLARTGGGIAEFIYPGEQITSKVSRQFGKLLAPALTNIHLDWTGLDVAQAPSCIPAVFAGGRLLVYGFIKTLSPRDKTEAVRMSADSPSGPVTFEVLLHTGSTPGRLVATLAARARIRELEESDEWTSSRGSRQHGRRAIGASREIIELSLRYGLISRETSYVAIERRDTPAGGDVQLRRVPVALTVGWGGLGSFRRQTWKARLTADPFPSVAMLPTQSYSRVSRPQAFADIAPRLTSSLQSGSESIHAAPVARDRRAAEMHCLVSLQHADGSWDLTPDFASAIRRPRAVLESTMPVLLSQLNDRQEAWATLIALAWLRTHAAGRQDEWQLLAAKAEQWLNELRLPPGERVALDEAAEALLRSLTPHPTL